MKWDVPEGELPMQVTDMDFETAPEIKEALTERATHGIFSYTVVPGARGEAVTDWQEWRHDFVTEKDWLVFTTEVAPAISGGVRKLTMVGENMLVQTPVYDTFFNSIRNNDRNIIENKPLYDGAGYRID